MRRKGSSAISRPRRRAARANRNRPDERDRAMDLNDAIMGRRSVREYTAQAVDEATIRRLTDAAVHAANAVNLQPWTFTVVRDQGLLDRVSVGGKAYMQANMPAGPVA